MIPHHVYYQLVILILLWLCIMLPHLWSSPPSGPPKTPTPSIKPRRRRSREPKPFAGLTQKPHCPLCEQEFAPSTQAPPPPRPDPMPPTHRRPVPWTPPCTFVPISTVTIAAGWGGITCGPTVIPLAAPGGSFTASAATGIFPNITARFVTASKPRWSGSCASWRAWPRDWAFASTARVLEVDANTVLHWLVEAAEHRNGPFPCYFLCDLHLQQLQLDELYAVLSAVKEGEISEAKAITP